MRRPASGPRGGGGRSADIFRRRFLLFLWPFGSGRGASAPSIGRDVAEEKELLARGVMPHEEGRGLVVAQQVVLPVQDRHRAHRHAVAKDGLVRLVEVQPLGRDGVRIIRC